MLAQLNGVLALATGTYSDAESTGDKRVQHADGQLVRYIDLYDAEGGEVIRMSLAQSVDPKSVPASPGVPVTVTATVAKRDGKFKFRVESIAPAGAANGRAPEAVKAAA
jgi:hypothetical protein